MKRFAFGVTMGELVGCAVLAAFWWTTLAARRPPFESNLIAFLVVMATVQVTSWVAVLWLSIRARSASSLGLALLGAGLGFVLLCSHLINGFTPAFGTPVAVAALCAAVPGLLVARRLTACCS